MQPVALKILTNTLRRKHEEKSRSIIDGNYDGSILHYRMRKPVSYTHLTLPTT